jgi:hypothetical protein
MRYALLCYCGIRSEKGLQTMSEKEENRELLASLLSARASVDCQWSELVDHFLQDEKDYTRMSGVMERLDTALEGEHYTVRSEFSDRELEMIALFADIAIKEILVQREGQLQDMRG